MAFVNDKTSLLNYAEKMLALIPLRDVLPEPFNKDSWMEEVILPISLVLTAGSSQKVYDGTPLTNDNYYISIGKIVEGHVLEVTISGSLTEVGTIKNVIDDVKIFDQNNKNVTKCYQITSNDGLLTII